MTFWLVKRFTIQKYKRLKQVDDKIYDYKKMNIFCLVAGKHISDLIREKAIIVSPSCLKCLISQRVSLMQTNI